MNRWKTKANSDNSFWYNQSLFIKQKDGTLLFDLWVFYANCVYTELFIKIKSKKHKIRKQRSILNNTLLKPILMDGQQLLKNPKNKGAVLNHLYMIKVHLPFQRFRGKYHIDTYKILIMIKDPFKTYGMITQHMWIMWIKHLAIMKCINYNVY